MTDVLMVMGSESDFGSMLGGVEILEEFGIDTKVQVASAHRTPARVEELIDEAETDGTKVIIAAAGMAAHLAGFIAGKTMIPVIGVPMESPHLSGLDSLYSTVMMPPGIPVATVGIGKPGAKNAAYLALAILALVNDNVREKMIAYRAGLGEKVAIMNANVQRKLNERGS
ncbi:MAG: 5-(carboxyamino)imidazole ribonucleotide mutase [Planctomycetes bacterium]|nr:5-(carboxyamino)imidazole ribonucleotide mutase [Planctomycetota bacterium]